MLTCAGGDPIGVGARHGEFLLGREEFPLLREESISWRIGSPVPQRNPFRSGGYHCCHGTDPFHAGRGGLCPGRTAFRACMAPMRSWRHCLRDVTALVRSWRDPGWMKPDAICAVGNQIGCKANQFRAAVHAPGRCRNQVRVAKNPLGAERESHPGTMRVSSPRSCSWQQPRAGYPSGRTRWIPGTRTLKHAHHHDCSRLTPSRNEALDLAPARALTCRCP